MEIFRRLLKSVANRLEVAVCLVYLVEISVVALYGIQLSVVGACKSHKLLGERCHILHVAVCEVYGYKRRHRRRAHVCKGIHGLGRIVERHVGKQCVQAAVVGDSGKRSGCQVHRAEINRRGIVARSVAVNVVDTVGCRTGACLMLCVKRKQHVDRRWVAGIEAANTILLVARRMLHIAQPSVDRRRLVGVGFGNLTGRRSALFLDAFACAFYHR